MQLTVSGSTPEMPMLATVQDVLALPELQHGKPEVVAGAAGLGRTVRWVHVSELADIATLLRGGELVLTTGIALPSSPQALARYLADLAEAEISGLVIELGRRFEAVPEALARAADRCALPLVALHREVRFVTVTEAVHSLIVNRQVAQLRLSDQVHQAFTALSVEGAPADAEVHARARALGVATERRSLTGVVVLLEPEAEAGGRWSRRSSARAATWPAALRAYLEHGRNKSAAADAFHLSRPAFYHRLATIERVLEVDLDSVESCLSLHVALLALDAVHGATGATRPR